MTSSSNPASGGAGAGLWIRVAANLSRRKVTWRLTEACLAQFPVPPGAPRSLMQKAAMGFLVELWGNIAEHTIDGVIGHFPDAQLESWAGWDGEPGAFATWLRAAHLDPETQRANEWEEFAGALQNKRTNDAERQRQKRERDKRARELLEASQESAASPAPPAPSTPAAPTVAGPYRSQLTNDDITELARDCTIAANKGMGDNEKIGGIYNPIIAGRGDSLEFVTFLAGEGVTQWDLIKRIVYSIAKAYQPERLGDHIKSLAFFRDRALAMWRRTVARAQAEQAGPIAEVPVSRGKTSPRDKANRSVAGAMAAAAAVGLSDG